MSLWIDLAIVLCVGITTFFCARGLGVSPQDVAGFVGAAVLVGIWMRQPLGR